MPRLRPWYVQRDLWPDDGVRAVPSGLLHQRDGKDELHALHRWPGHSIALVHNML